MKAHEKLRYVRFSIDCVRIRTYTSPITAADRPRAEEAAKEWGKTMKFTAHQINLPANVSVRPGQYARFSVCGGFLSVERSEEHTSELQSLMRISYAVFSLKKKNKN